MKKLFTFLVYVLLTASVFAQSPEKMSYQAVIRNSSDQLVTNQVIGMQISILQGSTIGLAVYVETQTPTTNENGLVSIEIGAGTTSDDFSAIDWANGPYFIKTETDTAGGTNYTITGTSQLLSVPYAMHAKTAETVTGGITETDPVFTAWDKDYNDLINTPAIPTVPTNVSAFTNDAGYLTSFTESQILTISNDTVFLTGGSFVKLPAGFDGDWSSLTGTAPNVSNFSNDAGYLTSFTESQILTISNDTIYLTGGSFVKLPAGFDGDWSSLTGTAPIVSTFPNDAGYLTSFTESQILTISNDTVFLTGGSFVKLPAGFDGDWSSLTGTAPIVSTFPNDAGYLTSFTESQILTISNDTVFLTGGSFVKLPAGFDGDWSSLTGTAPIVSTFPNDAGYLTSFTESQILTISNDTVFLTGGSFVKLPAGFDGDWSSLTGTPSTLSGYGITDALPLTGGNLTGSLTASGSATTLSGFNASMINETGTTYTLSVADNGKIITVDNAADITITVPTGLPDGFNCMIVQKGAGKAIFTAGGTTINNRSGHTKTAGTYAIATIVHLGSNVFITSGDMSN